MNKEQVTQCLHNFFNQERVRSTIATIKECDITGWEKWLQVEFAHYLQTKIYKNDEHEFRWYREYKVISSHCDKGDSQKEYILPDYWISSDKGENSYYLIELKCSNTGSLEAKMAEDVNKWNTYIEKHGRILACSSDSMEYRNSGVFFVGVDTKHKETEIEARDCVLEHCGHDFKYRIDFLSLDKVSEKA